VGGQHHAAAALPPGKTLPILQQAGWAPGPVWTCAKTLATTGIRYPDLLARSSVAIPTEPPGPQLIRELEIILINLLDIYIFGKCIIIISYLKIVLQI
jgi:hypothetical protein